MANICTNCGKELRDGVSFCSFCGEPIKKPAAGAEDVAYIVAPVSQEIAETPSPAFAVADAPKMKEEQWAPSNPVYEAPVYDAPPPPVYEPTPTYEAPPPPAFEAPPNYTPPDFEPVAGGSDEQITAWGFFGINLLMCVPLVNLIFLIVWACGGCRKRNKRSYARGQLLTIAFSIVLTIILTCAVIFWLAPYIREAINEFSGIIPDDWRSFEWSFGI